MDIDKSFVEYLKSLGYSIKKIEKAWKKTLELCKRYTPQYLDQETTLQVMTRDILKGEVKVEKILKEMVNK